MSTISEVDLRDWDRVDFTVLKKYGNDTYIQPNPWDMIKFYEQVLEVYRKQMKNVPVLLRKET